jgi:hypothetical protein
MLVAGSVASAVNTANKRNPNRFLFFVFTDAASAAVAEEFGLETRKELVATGSRNGTLKVYVNYAHGNEGQVAWYSERKLPKLRALKSRWDPKQLFHWTNGITQQEAGG